MKPNKTRQIFLQQWGNIIGLRFIYLMLLIGSVGFISHYVFGEKLDMAAFFSYSAPLCLVCYFSGLRHGYRGDYQEKSDEAQTKTF